MPNTKSVIKIHGGKSRLCSWILSHFPKDYQTLPYYELYGGGASLLLNKKRSDFEYYGELDPLTYSAFYYAKSQPLEFEAILKQLEYSEKTFKECLAYINFIRPTISLLSDARPVYLTDGRGGVPLPIDVAVAWVVVKRWSRGGLGSDFSQSTRLRGGQNEGKNSWENFLKGYRDLVCRLSSVKIENRNAELNLKELANKTNFVCQLFLDPPYLKETRTAKEVYDYEMTHQQHSDMLDLLVKININNPDIKILLCGYDSKLYNDMLPGWRKIEKTVKNNSGQGKTKQTRLECLWLSY